MAQANWVTRIDDPFYRELDWELEQANVEIDTLHDVLDRVGAPGAGGKQGLNVGERLKALAAGQLRQESRRAEIGCHYLRHPRWKFLVAIPLIYMPILVGLLPLIVTTFLVRSHLKLAGGHNLLSYWDDFVPSWVSHRYSYATQIRPVGLFERFGAAAFFARSKLFWLFNCKLYCPLSVALLGYLLYLVKIVEQWWCPFAHDQKASYADAPIDLSFWHASGDATLLDPEDRENTVWNRPPERSTS